MRSNLAEAALELDYDPAQARQLVQQAQAAYLNVDAALRTAAPQAATQVRASLAHSLAAARSGDEVAYAAAQARTWTAWLGGAYAALEQSVKAGRAGEARSWLATREFRQASRFTRLNADATTAVEGLAAGKVTPTATLEAVRSDLLDGYKARLYDALAGVAVWIAGHGWIARHSRGAYAGP